MYVLGVKIIFLSSRKMEKGVLNSIFLHKPNASTAVSQMMKLCTSIHLSDDDKPKIIGSSVSAGAKTPSVSVTLNKTQSVMVEDVFKLTDDVSNGFKDGGYKHKKEEKDKKRWKKMKK